MLVKWDQVLLKWRALLPSYRFLCGIRNKEFLGRQIARIDENLKRIVAKGGLHDGDRHEAMNRIKAVESIEELGECDFVIEVIEGVFERDSSL